MTNYATVRGWEKIMSYLNLKNDLFMSTQRRVMSREGPLSYPELALPNLPCTLTDTLPTTWGTFPSNYEF
jgi:hypothetical protein